MKSKLAILFISYGIITAFIIKGNLGQGIYPIVGSIILALFMYYIAIKIIVSSINKFNMTLADISNGNIAKKLETDTNDILKTTATYTNQILDNTKRLIADVIASSQKTTIYSDNLKNHAEVSSRASQEIATAVTEIASGVAEQFNYITKVKSNTTDMIESSNRISSYSTNALESSKNMNHTINSNETTINDLITKMKNNSEKGIKRTNKIKELEHQVKEISNIISAVTDISDQTNLLALNASIEAARAGEAGKGFTVVANEVKKLAAQSASSAEEVSTIINKISNSILGFVKEMEQENDELEQSIVLADKAKKCFDEIVLSSQETMNAVESINNNTSKGVDMAKKIDSFINEISNIIEESAANTQETSASSEEQSASMEEIFNSIKDLRDMTQEVYNKAEEYLNNYKFDEETKKRIEICTNILKELSADPNVSTMEWDVISPILRKKKEQHKMFDFIGVMNHKGIFSGANDDDLKGEDYSHRIYFKEAIKGNEYLTKPYITHPYYNFAVGVSIPIKKDGKIIGVIMGDVLIG